MIVLGRLKFLSFLQMVLYKLRTPSDCLTNFFRCPSAQVIFLFLAYHFHHSRAYKFYQGIKNEAVFLSSL